MKKLWIRIRYQNELDDWMEVPMNELEEWKNVVHSSCIKESVNNPLKEIK